MSGDEKRFALHTIHAWRLTGPNCYVIVDLEDRPVLAGQAMNAGTYYFKAVSDRTSPRPERARIVAALVAEVGNPTTAERLADVVLRALEGGEG